MTFVHNRPENFVPEALSGLVKAHPGRLRAVPGGIARADGTRPGKVAVVVGGGSGHYPAFAGLVGDGLADAAVCGDIFTSPSTRQVLDVCRAADAGAGVFVTFGNYAGDVLNFGAAASRLRAQGTDVTILLVTDDVASAPADRHHDRRGVAGDLVVFKLAGAAAEEGADLAEVNRLAAHGNDRTRSFGVAFDGCTLPGHDHPLFTLEPGVAAWGLGIHGEPGIGEEARPSAAALATELVDRVLAERPADADGRAAVLLNGLGNVKYEELFVLWDTVHDLLVERGVTIVAPLVGEYVTSLDMAGCSLTVTWLDDELERLWLAPADAPGFHHGSWRPAPATTPAPLPSEPETELVRATTPEGIAAAGTVASLFHRAQVALHDAEQVLGDLDAVAADGDHGRGMCRGIDAAVAAADDAVRAGGDAPSVLRRAADAWADKAGGTSGALWGVGLLALADALPADAALTIEHVAAGIVAARDQIQEVGGARVGDKTLVDALHPAAEALAAAVAGGAAPADAWRATIEAADQGVEATKDIAARRGRARVLGDKSLGVPDPGATSLALLLKEAGAEAGVPAPTTTEVDS
ncbi:dihydroxyacetone kinase family protein [Promicromonospora citrea]|uniref:Erythrulose kinase n=1 Tax=Promicromonospora citrea TaxID=43677 RepID=A0A8H9L542_9MICO|nr:dihydroxyacetone kinase family protein [Promicromonospora citrea]NNH51034.1 dihydroxyacetone kinase family protein [Promicromonospora citrea]GGM29745.1 erythrulose kinase [Promicromonospora citrea]